MNKSRHRQTWFELGTGLGEAQNKAHVRLNIIRCSKCDRSTSEQHGQADEVLRKKFLRRGWFVGKNTGQHLCPEHAQKAPKPSKKDIINIIPPKSARAFICMVCDLEFDKKEVLSIGDYHACIACIDDGIRLLLRTYRRPAKELEKAPEACSVTHNIQDQGTINATNEEDQRNADIIFGKRK